MTRRRRVILTVTSGPNAGDTLKVDEGTCRLIGRHLSEHETALIDRDGNRILDAGAAEILIKHLKERAPATGITAPPEFSSAAFDRGPDAIFADDSISRAHAMIFFDTKGIGIIDLASTNGTYVNSERVGSAMVRDGDTLAIGGSELALAVH
ncbi:MAG: FHA domain-containing protein [Myxococcota bacterium]